MEFMDYFLTGLTWFFASFVHGLSGMGSGMIAVPLTSLWINTQTSIVIGCLMMPILSLALAWKFLAKCDKKCFFVLLFTSLPGSIVGTYLLIIVPILFLQLSMAIFLFAYTFWALFTKKHVSEPRENMTFLAIAGFFSGIAGATLSFFAPPIAIYIVYASWSPEKTLATFSAAALFMSILTCILQALAGIYTMEIAKLTAVAGPASLAGLLLAFPFVKYISQKTFKTILFIVIAVSGATAGARALATMGIL